MVYAGEHHSPVLQLMCDEPGRMNGGLRITLWVPPEPAQNQHAAPIVSPPRSNRSQLLAANDVRRPP